MQFATERDLYQAYMPFLKQGGLFFKTGERFELGEEVTLKVHLPNEAIEHTIAGKICWLTPPGAQSGTPAGIGIAFVEDKNDVRNTIEKSIARMLNSSEPTMTM